MMKTKRGMELTMNTIVIAVIALIILIVLVLIFTGRIRITGEETEKVVQPYTGEKCSIPGTGRTCRFQNECESMGGLNNGQLDCTVGICCSK
ncbi:hypothetical protein HY488_01770 [Candidatus Woesearchaeota archaeon]|nr:hypothetical protein [Candidatus Woesearchaeota archaeon]